MPSLDELRSQYPVFNSLSDRDLVSKLAAQSGNSEDYIADQYGVQKNTAGFATDTAVDVGRGLLSIPKAAVGLGNLATGGAVGRGLKATFGGDLEDVDKKLTGYYSNNRQDAQADVDSAHGFADSAKAYLRHPGLLAGEAIQGVAGMALPVGMAGKVGSVVEKQLALKAAELGMTGAEAATFITDGVKASLANKLAAPAAFGVTAAGQAADESIHNDPNNMGAMYGSAAGAGAANAAGMHISSLLPGGGAAQSFATKGILGQLDGNVAARTGVAMANQAGTMAGINAGSTISGNVANDRPWEQGVPESMVSGGMGGALFGAAHGLTHGKMKANADGEITVGDKTLAPDQVPGHIEQLDAAAQEQHSAAQTQASQQELGRSAMAAKYGVKDHTYVGADGVEVKDGFDFIGKHLTSQDALNKALDTLAARESSTKKLGQLQGEIALTNVLRARGVEDLNPSSIYKADGSITDARSIVLDAADEHAVLGRVNERIADETTAQAKATASLEKAQGRLDTAKAALDQTGMDTTVTSAAKAVETNKQKLEDSQKRLGFYNDWAKALQDHTGAKNGEVPISTNEGPNGRDQTLSKDGEGTVASHVDGANNEASKAPDNQRPELNVVEKQPDQKAEVAPVAAPEAVKAPVVAVAPREKTIEALTAKVDALIAERNAPKVEAPVIAKAIEPVAAEPVKPVKKIVLAPRTSEAMSAAARAPIDPVSEMTVQRSRRKVAVSADTIAAANAKSSEAKAATDRAMTAEPVEASARVLPEPVAEKVIDPRDAVLAKIKNKTTLRDAKMLAEYIDGKDASQLAVDHGTTTVQINNQIRLHDEKKDGVVTKAGLKSRLRREGLTDPEIMSLVEKRNVDTDLYKREASSDVHLNERVDAADGATKEAVTSVPRGIDSDTVHDPYAEQAEHKSEDSIQHTNGFSTIDALGGSKGETHGLSEMPHSTALSDAYIRLLDIENALDKPVRNTKGGKDHALPGEPGKLFSTKELNAMKDEIMSGMEKLKENSAKEHSKIAASRKESSASIDSMAANRDAHAMERMHDLGVKNKTVEQFLAENPEHDIGVEAAMSRNIDGSPFSGNPKIAAIQEAKARLDKMMAERARSEFEQKRNDAELKDVVDNTVRPLFDKLGIAHKLDAIDSYSTKEMPVADNGYLAHNKTQGTTALVVSAKLMDAARTGDPVAVQKLHDTVIHEVGHGVDESVRGGIYSAQIEIGFRDSPDGVKPTGIVSTELMNHFTTGDIFARDLKYPLHEEAGYTHDPVKTAKELFAQAWALYHNADTHADFAAYLPTTAKYISEVINHVKNTATEVRSKTDAGTQQRRAEFAARGKVDTTSDGNSAHRRGLYGEERSPKEPDTGATHSDGSNDRAAATGNAGTTDSTEFSRSVPDASNVTPAVRASVIEDNIKRLPVGLQKPVRGITANITHFATRGLQSAAFLHDLADWGGKHGLPAMKEISRLFSEKGALKSELDKKLGAIAQMYDDLQPRTIDRLTKGLSKDQIAVGEYLRDAQFTHDNKWGYVPEWKKEAVTSDAAKADWGKLSPAAQKVVDAILQHNSETRTAMQEAFNSHINEMHDANVEAAGGDKDKIAAVEKERATALKDVKMAQGGGAYSPVKRFGDHVVTVHSHELNELKKDYALNRDKINEMQQDPQHYQVMHYDTAGEAANKAAELGAQYKGTHDIQASEKEKLLEFGTQSHQVLQHMSEAATRNADPEFAKVINNTLTHAIIKSMGEQTSRSSELHRKLIYGMKPEEMIRAFVTNGYSDNATLSAVMHNKDVATKMRELHEQVHSDPATRKEKQNFYNEIQQRRINSAKMHDPAPWVSHAMRFTSVWKLITSPAYYLQYLSQPLTMAAPVLQGRHGYAEGMKAIYHGIRDSHNMMDVINGKKKLGGAEGANLTNMLDSLQKTGTISIGHSEQFGRYHNRPEGSLSREWVRATDKLSQLPHTVEMHNRVGTAVGAYKLEYAKAVKEGATAEAAHAQATDYARGVINTAYGDYSSYNAPRIMTGGPMRKLAFQYRQFQAIHGAMLVRAMNQAFSGEPAVVKTAARHQLTFMAAHYGILAGALGIPGAHLVAGALQQVFGDSDGPENTDLFIKRHVGDGALGRMITEGLPGLAGMKLSNRMGAGDIFSPFRGDTPLVPTTKKEYSDYALAVAGPFLGAMVPQVIDGVGRIGKGDYYRGLEQLMPKGIADVMKATRFATEGVSNRKGDTTLSADALGAGDIASQAFGASPLKVADAQAVQNNVHNFEQRFKDKINELSFNFNQARKDGTPVEATVEKWKAMQEAQKREGFKMTPLSMLYQSPMRQAKRERATIGGVEYNKNNKSFVQSMIGGEE